MKGAVAFRCRVRAGQAYGVGTKIEFPTGIKGRIKKINSIDCNMRGEAWLIGWFVPLDSETIEST